jgi:hypothetical protein
MRSTELGARVSCAKREGLGVVDEQVVGGVEEEAGRTAEEEDEAAWLAGV